MTRSNQLAGIEGEDSGVIFIGKEGKAFEFKDLPAEVQFEESSALDLETLAGVKNWICSKAQDTPGNCMNLETLCKKQINYKN